MSLALFTLGSRLRAADTGQPVTTAVYAPTIPLLGGIAVTIDSDGDHIHITATNGTSTAAGTDLDGLNALATLGATMTVRRPLIIGTDRELATLTALARTYPDADASPVIGWWDERADYPGTDAVHIATEAAQRRWTLGVHPDREREIATWAEWLHIDTTGAQLVLDLARLTASGHTLPGLLHASTLDTASWDRYSDRLTAGRRWYAKDSQSDAALGLIGRSHAAEWYESLRLGDPLVALAASHNGTVVTGTIAARTTDSITLHADRPLSRLREDTKVSAWRGEPIDARNPECLTGTVAATAIEPHIGLTLTIEGLPRSAQSLKPGERISLRPSRVDPNMQTTARSLAASGYRRGGWVAGRGKPYSARRGDVPLDVIVAAAD